MAHSTQIFVCLGRVNTVSVGRGRRCFVRGEYENTEGGGRAGDGCAGDVSDGTSCAEGGEDAVLAVDAITMGLSAKGVAMTIIALSMNAMVMDAMTMVTVLANAKVPLDMLDGVVVNNLK